MNAVILRMAAALVLTAATCVAGAAAESDPNLPAASVEAGGTVLAEVRIGEDTPQAEEHLGTAYVWLGAATVRLTIEVRPAPGHVLELDWGAKNDPREALARVNGRPVVVRGGGYNGFRPLRVRLPQDVSGERYEIILEAAGGKAGFIGGVRLIAAGGPKDPSPAAPRAIVLAVGPPTTPEAFPEMRALWDREPTPPAGPSPDARREAAFGQAEKNARQAAEGLFRCRRFVDGWLAHADPKSGLIPRNLGDGKDLWNAKDSAADNYPFMVLTCAIADRPLFDGRMLEMLRAEERLTSRIGRLPDDFLFSKQGFAAEKPNVEAVVFGSAEYVKDGLIPLTEWLGPSPWSERMLGILDDVWQRAAIDTPYGRVPTLDVEVGGDLLQASSRAFWMTGRRAYLDWAIRLGDYYLLGDHHPTRDLKSLRLIDHGCEVVNGLSELYVAVAFAAPDKKKAYEKPMHEMLDRLLEVGRNEDGMLYAQIDPKTGEHARELCDTWGYDYDAFYAVYLIDKTEAYRQAVRKALGNLKGKYVGAPWADRSADGYADSIEGAINLLNVEPIPSAAEWIESQTRLMWAIQKSDGVIEGWHGDGNFARTTLMYCLWKTQGLTLRPWRKDVRVGAVRDGDSLLVSLAADEPWQGRLVFDVARHKVHMKLPLDYPRINRFPEWFTVEDGRSYAVRNLATGPASTHTGQALRDGLAVELKGGAEVRLVVEIASPGNGPGGGRPKNPG